MLGAGFSIKIISSTSTQANSIRRFNLGGGDLYHVQKNHHAFRHNFQVYFLFVRPGYFFSFKNDKSNNFGGGDNSDNEVKMVLSIRIGCKSDLGFQLVK